jgi:hypothetical protein
MSHRGLSLAAGKAASMKEFVASDLARFHDAGEAGEELLSRWLELDDERLALLSLCRTPRRDSGFREDVRQIAEFVSADEVRLASLVRLSDALMAFAAAPAAARQTVLAAARDADGEPSLVDDLPPLGARYQPTWLHRAAEIFWGEDVPGSFPVQLELEALTRLPLALVEIENLSTDGLEGWLEAYETHLHLHAAPRHLRAALIAYAGTGVIFIDADLDESERRVSVAHETGHFITDYLLARSEVEERAPDLLEVLDGLREPEEDDYITALLNRLPLGVHTHLLARSDYGEYGSAETERSEERATRVAWELLAPQACVEQRTDELANTFELVKILRTDFGFPAEAARTYAKFLSRLEGGENPFDRRFGFES